LRHANLKQSVLPSGSHVLPKVNDWLLPFGTSQPCGLGGLKVEINYVADTN